MQAPDHFVVQLMRPFGWRRLRVMLITTLLITLVMQLTWEGSNALLIGRLWFVGSVQLLLFGLLERRPPRLPRWIARWALQVVVVTLVVPFAMAIAYALTNPDPTPWYHDKSRMNGYSALTAIGLFITPWIATSALLRQIRDEAQRQALAFELERSRFERDALDAQLRLLQAQVEPHFLFNTLANIRELVEAQSPQAPRVLESLIAYLRAAVPRLHTSSNSLEQEFELVHAYLDVMQMRMPDRLQYTLSLDPAVAALPCPPMMLLTLVENAVRHGIDPSVDGGRIDVSAQRDSLHCLIRVQDSGVGMSSSTGGLGTGLATLRERLRLAYGNGDAARLDVAARQPHGVTATIVLPLQREGA